MYRLCSITMQEPTAYDPNDPDIYLPFSPNNPPSTTTNLCHICNVCEIEKGSTLRCRCTHRCEKHKEDTTSVVKHEVSVKQ